MLTLALIPFALLGIAILIALAVALGWIVVIGAGIVAIALGYHVTGIAACTVGLLWLLGIGHAAS